MKLALKGFLGILAALALSLAISPVFAATAANTTVQAPKIVDIQALTTSIVNKGQQVRTIEAQKIASLKKIDNSKKDAKRLAADQSTLNYINDARNRLTKSITDLQNVAAQLASRISSLKAAGKDTTTASNDLTIANTNIQAAQDHITAFTDTQNQAINAEKLSDGIVIVGTALTDIETSLKTARQNLTDTVSAIKAATGTTAPATH
jgi:chromosome segregation ATPase